MAHKIIGSTLDTEIVNLYLAHHTYQQIGDKLGMSRENVRLRLNIKLPNRPPRAKWKLKSRRQQPKLTDEQAATTGSARTKVIHGVYPYKLHPYKKKHDRAACTAALVRIALDLNRLPTGVEYVQLRTQTEPCKSIIQQRHGDWRKALSTANLILQTLELNS